MPIKFQEQWLVWLGQRLMGRGGSQRSEPPKVTPQAPSRGVLGVIRCIVCINFTHITDCVLFTLFSDLFFSLLTVYLEHLSHVLFHSTWYLVWLYQAPVGEHQVISGLGSPGECCRQHCNLCGTWQVAFRLQMWIHPTPRTPAGGVLRESFAELQFHPTCLRNLLGSLLSSLPLFLPSLPFQWLCSQEKKFWEKYEKRGESPLPSY